MTNAIDLISDSFSTEQCNAYSLSIREFPNGFSFCVMHMPTNKCVAIKHIPNSTLSQLLREEPLLQLPFAQINVVTHAPFALVPEPLLISSQPQVFLPLDTFQQQRAKVQINNTPYQAKCIFDKRRFPQFSSKQRNIHPLTLLIHLLDSLSKRDLLLAEVTEKQLYMVVMKNGKIVLANSFEIENISDASYYILATYEHLELDTETTSTLLCGEQDKSNDIIELMKPYIRDIRKVDTDNVWPHLFPSSLYSYFYTLTLSHLCE